MTRSALYCLDKWLLCRDMEQQQAVGRQQHKCLLANKQRRTPTVWQYLHKEMSSPRAVSCFGQACGWCSSAFASSGTCTHARLRLGPLLLRRLVHCYSSMQAVTPPWNSGAFPCQLSSYVPKRKDLHAQGLLPLLLPVPVSGGQDVPPGLAIL